MKKLFIFILLLTSVAFSMEFSFPPQKRLSPSQQDLLGTPWARKGGSLPNPQKTIHIHDVSQSLQPAPPSSKESIPCTSHKKESTKKKLDCLICPHQTNTLAELASHIRLKHECFYCGSLLTYDAMSHHAYECPYRKGELTVPFETLSAHLFKLASCNQKKPNEQ